MKTNLFMALAFAFLMLFAACTEEKIIYVEKDNDVELLPGEGILTISLSDITTRAARPIDHFDPIADLVSGGNNVNKIGFRIYNNSGNLVSGVKVTSWNGGAISTDTELNDYILSVDGEALAKTPQQLKLSGLSTGVYTIVAYGYNGDTCPYTIESETSEMYLKALTKDEDKFFEELFAGSLEVSANDYGNFTQEYTLTLYRQIAGMLAYLENIPAYVGEERVHKITITTITENIGFYFPHTLLSENSSPFSDKNGIVTDWAKDDLLTFTFNENTVSNWNTVAMGATYQFNGVSGKKFLLPDEMDDEVKNILTENLMCIPNTLFGSCFLIPTSGSNYTHKFDGEKEARTALHLVFWGEEDKVLKVLNLKEFTDGKEEAYCIQWNHFYSLGTKTKSEPDDGKEPDEEDDKDTDDPLDINTNAGVEYLLLKINDAWDGNYDLIYKEE